MNYEFHPEALEEFESAVAFYSLRQKGLEVRFIDTVVAAIKRACDSPQTWRKFDGEIRRVLVQVFPYAILFISLR